MTGKHHRCASIAPLLSDELVPSFNSHAGMRGIFSINVEGSLKKKFSMALLAMAVASTISVASAQDNKAPMTRQGAQSVCCMDSKEHMGQMDEHMKRMQALHEKMVNATNPEDRQRLMDDQRREMQQGMAMMQGASHGGSMMGGAGMGTIGQKGKPADEKTQMQMMEKRMDMMQAMMQTMMDLQGASGSTMMQSPTK